jgi:hypothetical protein
MRKKSGVIKKGIAVMGHNAHSTTRWNLPKSAKCRHKLRSFRNRGGGDIRLSYPFSRVDNRGVEEFQKTLNGVNREAAGISSCLEHA